MARRRNWTDGPIVSLLVKVLLAALRSTLTLRDGGHQGPVSADQFNTLLNAERTTELTSNMQLPNGYHFEHGSGHGLELYDSRGNLVLGNMRENDPDAAFIATMHNLGYIHGVHNMRKAVLELAQLEGGLSCDPWKPLDRLAAALLHETPRAR